MVDYDFDTIVKKKKTFKLDGKELNAPGSIPVKHMVKIMKLSKDLEEGDPDSILEYVETLYEILASVNDLNRDEFTDKVDMELAVALFNWISNGTDPVETMKEIEKKKAEMKDNKDTSKKKE